MVKFWWQRRTRGWDDSETWSLDVTLAKWMLPRFKRFQEINKGIPIVFFQNNDTSCKNVKAAKKAMDKAYGDILYWLEEKVKGNDGVSVKKGKIVQDKRFKAGRENFTKYLDNFWW